MLKDPGFWLGVYGSLVATVLAVRELRANHRRVRVTSYDNSEARKLGILVEIPALVIRVVNLGTRPVVINGAGVQLSDKTRLVLRGDFIGPAGNFPKTLEDGETTTVVIPIAEVKAALQNGAKAISCFALDSSGRNYFGRLPVVFRKH